MTDVTLEVINIASATEIKSGNPIATITFGEYITADQPITNRIARIPSFSPPVVGSKLPVATLVLFYPLTGIVPYKMGSKWKLSINADNGNISLNEIR